MHTSLAEGVQFSHIMTLKSRFSIDFPGWVFLLHFSTHFPTLSSCSHRDTILFSLSSSRTKTARPYLTWGCSAKSTMPASLGLTFFGALWYFCSLFCVIVQFVCFVLLYSLFCVLVWLILCPCRLIVHSVSWYYNIVSFFVCFCTVCLFYFIVQTVCCMLLYSIYVIVQSVCSC